MTLILNGTDNSATTPAVTGTDTDTGVYYPAANQVALATGGTLAMLANASQGVQFANAIGVGATTPTTSGAGITFPATQSASSNANTLDDYEEGTWTPVIKFGSTTATLTSTSASYTKVGRVVTLMIEAYVTNLNGGTGGFSISSFPFNAYSYNRQTVAQFYFQFMSASFPAGDKFAFIQPNDSTLGVNYFTGSSGTAGSLDNTHFTTSSYVYANIIYFAP